ncbi:hypothetical protein JB92DRAFT_2725835 [Gautieria morchelliformis]|nr:hypothetical protein JB92DRAFT_2725835 [Gautieria morchelliformis]
MLPLLLRKLSRRLAESERNTTQGILYTQNSTGLPNDANANRSARFIDAYQKGLTGSQAVWANRRYHGHHILPGTILEELEKAGKK